MIKRVVVVGGGAMGVFAASAIKRRCRDVDVVMVHDPKTPYLGVGESIGWNGPDFMNMVFGLKESDWFTQSGSTYKHAVEHVGFDGTQNPSLNIHRWNPSFNAVLAPIVSVLRDNHKNPQGRPVGVAASGEEGDQITLSDAWMHLYHKGLRSREDYDGDMGELYWYAKFNTVPDQRHNKLYRLSQSYHFNADYIKDVIYEKVAVPLGVKTIEGFVGRVITKGNNIQGIEVNGKTVEADLFIDCTGFKRVLASSVGCEWVDLHDGFNNAAIVGNSAHTTASGMPPTCKTEHHAMDSGWVFRIPLDTRYGNGYVFNQSRSPDVDVLVDEFDQKFGTKSQTLHRVIKWAPGHLKNTFVNNCVVMGVGSIFVDPYEANNFSTQMSVLHYFVELLGSNRDYNQWRDVYNDYTNSVAQDSILRISTGLFMAQKQDTQYWRDNYQIGLDTKIREKMCEVVNGRERKYQRNVQNVFWFQAAYTGHCLYVNTELPKPVNPLPEKYEQVALSFFKHFNEKHRLQAQHAESVESFYRRTYRRQNVA